MIKVSDYIAKRLFELGARHVFMVTGGGAMHLNDSFARSQPFKVLYQHHEQACAIAAEGLYRANGGVGIVNITTGPGGLNTLTGVMGQWTDSIPAIYVSGQVKQTTTVASCRELPLRQLGDQEVDIIPVVKPLVKYAVSITDPKRVRLEVEKAFHASVSGRPGPVWIDVPMDVQGAPIDENQLIGFMEPAVPRGGADIEKILDLLRGSRRPVIVTGHGIRLAGVVSEARELLERLGIPAVSTFNGYDVLPNAHPSFCGRIGTIGNRAGNFTLQNADLVLFLGTRNNVRQVSYNWENFAHRATTVSIDIDPAELAKPTFRPDHAFVADLRDVMPALLEAARFEEPVAGRAEWLSWCRKRLELHPVVRPEHLLEAERINPYPFIETFTQGLPEDATVVAGNGTACVVLFQAGIAKASQRVFWNSGCASMGFDLPAAIGAAVAKEGVVWCLAGDGSLQMNLQELATVSHNGLALKLVFLDNGGYASIRQTQTNFFKAQYGCGIASGLGFPDMEKLACAYGIRYVRTTRLEDVAAHQALVADGLDPVIWDVKLKLDYSFEPKLSSEKLPDGRIVSKPLEDMFPFLSREDFAANIHPDVVA